MNDKTTTEGAKIIFVTSQYGLQQITNEPTHLLENSQSCIDLIFTSYPNLIVNAKFNLKIHSPHLTNKKWCYGQGNTGLIRRAVQEFNSQVAFSNLYKSKTIYFSNKTILNIVLNFIPHETVICDDRDPPWVNTGIKNPINDKKYL